MMRRWTMEWLCVAGLAVTAAGTEETGVATSQTTERIPRVQIAILLDVSGSMEKLIDQARTKLWSILNEVTSAQRDGVAPTIEVALYRYGSKEDPADGHVRCMAPLTRDLDQVSEELFRLAVGGGEEYCGMAIRRAVSELSWSTDAEDLKLILIAGNETFAQGSVLPDEACSEAIARGIVVTTMFCGPALDGVTLGWERAAKRADGEFLSIDVGRAEIQVTSPQDKEILRLSERMNDTYLPYGPNGIKRATRQRQEDKNAVASSRRAAIQRAKFKASKNYRNGDWDLLDALGGGSIRLGEIPNQHLPENMRSMSLEEKQAFVRRLLEKRRELQSRLSQLTEVRRVHVAKEAKALGLDFEAEFDQKVIQMVRRLGQARRFEFK